MNQAESKYYATARRMDEALVGLLAEKEFEYVTVKEICERAGVNRSTFYLHYETIGDLLNEVLAHSANSFQSSFPASSTGFAEQIGSAPLEQLILIRTEYLRPYLTFIRDHRRMYAAAFRNPSGMQTDRMMVQMTRIVLKPILNRFGVPRGEQDYWIAFYVSGCQGLVKTWVERGCDTPVEDMESIMIACIRPSMDDEKKPEA